MDVYVAEEMMEPIVEEVEEEEEEEEGVRGIFVSSAFLSISRGVIRSIFPCEIRCIVFFFVLEC